MAQYRYLGQDKPPNYHWYCGEKLTIPQSPKHAHFQYGHETTLLIRTWCPHCHIEVLMELATFRLAREAEKLENAKFSEANCEQADIRMRRE